MNILPKKSWHVRNKDNVARVRRDEAKALEEEQEVAKRRALAEQEARIRILREKSKSLTSAKKTAEWDLPQEPKAEADDEDEETGNLTNEKAEYAPLNTAFPADKHINLFEDFEKKKKSQGANQDYEDEKRKAQETYEKKIGYLTYLGQSASETLSKKPWYEKLPTKRDDKSELTKTKFSEQETMRNSDPLLSMKGYLDKKKHAEDIFYGRTKEVSLGMDRSRKRRFNDNQEKSYVHEDNSKRNKRPETSSEKDSSTSQLESTSNTDSKKHKHKKDSKKKKNKKQKRSPERSPEPKRPTIDELRASRVEREAAERQRSLALVSRLQGYSTPARSIIDERTLKYNTVYMPRGRRT